MDASIFYNLLRSLAPKGNTQIINGGVDALLKYAPQFGLTNTNRIAHFVAQCAWESAGFTTLSEMGGISYFNKYEPGTTSGRNLGNTIKGDGYRFRGRGYIQITGRSNYGAASIKMFGDNRLLTNPDLLLIPEWGMLSSLHFWNDRNLNALADRNDITGVTKKVNGLKTTTIPQRTKLLNAAFASLSGDVKKKSGNVYTGSTADSSTTSTHSIIGDIGSALRSLFNNGRH